MENDVKFMPENLGSTKHEMMHEQVKKHGAGHKHHSQDFMKEAAGHEYEQDKVRKMCGGGMYKK